jgi:hypothetical protein
MLSNMDRLKYKTLQSNTVFLLSIQVALKNLTQSLNSLEHVINSKCESYVYKLDYFSTAMLVSVIFKTPLIKKIMKWTWGFRIVPLSYRLKTVVSNLIIIIIIIIIYIVYKGMTLHNISEFYTVCFSACPNITSTFRITAIFKSSVWENNDRNKTCRCVHDLPLHKTSCV